LIEQAIFAGGPKVKLLLSGDATTQNGYVVMQIPMDPDSKAQFATNPDQVFRDIAGKISGVTGQAIPERPVTQNGLQGRQFSVDVAVAKDKKQLLMRIFAAGDNLVILQATSDDATPARHAQAFFESFKVK